MSLEMMVQSEVQPATLSHMNRRSWRVTRLVELSHEALLTVAISPIQTSISCYFCSNLCKIIHTISYFAYYHYNKIGSWVHTYCRTHNQALGSELLLCIRCKCILVRAFSNTNTLREDSRTCKCGPRYSMVFL